MVTPNGIITTVAGNGTPARPATASRPPPPSSTIRGTDRRRRGQSLYRRLCQQRGSHGRTRRHHHHDCRHRHPGNSGNGGLATAAELNAPYDTAIDSAGNVYRCRHTERKIRQFAIDGDMNTVRRHGHLRLLRRRRPRECRDPRLPASREHSTSRVTSTYRLTDTNSVVREVIPTSGPFTVVPLPPVVSGLTPTAGPVAGDTAVTIIGTNFNNATAVYFGTRHAATSTS